MWSLSFPCRPAGSLFDILTAIQIKSEARVGNLIDENEAERYEELYGAGLDHSYPNENIVRLISSFFGGIPPENSNKCLDYGFGPGENLIHLLKLGLCGSAFEQCQGNIPDAQFERQCIPQTGSSF